MSLLITLILLSIVAVFVTYLIDKKEITTTLLLLIAAFAMLGLFSVVLDLNITAEILICIFLLVGITILRIFETFKKRI